MKTYQAWRGLFSSHYFNHLDDGEWVNISFIKYLKLKFFGYSVRVLTIPEEGSYIEKNVGCQFRTYTYKGIVRHHTGSKSYYIKTSGGTICNLR